VTVTCSPQNFELLKSLGADEVLDYNAVPEGVAAPGSPSGKKYDVIINCGPHRPFPQYKPQLAHSGFVIDLNPSTKGFMTSAIHTFSLSKQKYFPFMHIPNCADMYLLFHLLHMKRIKLVIDSTYPLAKAQEAWARCIEGHAVGKIVISVCEPLLSIIHGSSLSSSPGASLSLSSSPGDSLSRT
jgi:NADPH:quinone reductase-like Zn-dependent oxidoreductase